MKLLKISEIGSKILSLIDGSHTNMTIVSPYNKIGNWPKLLNRINLARQRGVKFNYYIRSDQAWDVEQFATIGITPYCVPDLHAKLYLNEKNGIVTSMNLHSYSDANSIEIAYETENDSEFQDLVDYCTRNIISRAVLFNDNYGRTISIEKQFYTQVGNMIEAHYPNCKPNAIDSYLFCGSLLENCDVMISTSCITFKMFYTIEPTTIENKVKSGITHTYDFRYEISNNKTYITFSFGEQLMLDKNKLVERSIDLINLMKAA